MIGLRLIAMVAFNREGEMLRLVDPQYQLPDASARFVADVQHAISLMGRAQSHLVDMPLAHPEHVQTLLIAAMENAGGTLTAALEDIRIQLANWKQRSPMDDSLDEGAT